MSKLIDLTRRKFGRLTVISRGKKKSRHIYWICLCDCGKTVEVEGNKLKNGWTQSCKCLRWEAVKNSNSRLIPTGQTFGRLAVIEHVPKPTTTHSRTYHYLCKCICGNEVIINGSNLRNGHSQSCGCIFQELKGPNHPSWKPHLSAKDRARQRGPEINQWRKSVFAHDNYSCNICSKRGGKLNAHHKDGWHHCKERRFDVSNGITLCKEHHAAFHKLYGISNNTEEQYIQWLKTLHLQPTAFMLQ